MIIKSSPIRAAWKSQYSLLAAYIAKPKEGVAERVERVTMANFPDQHDLANSEYEGDWEVASWMIDARHERKQGITKPMTYHVIVSFRPEEADKLTQDDFDQIAEEVAECIGLGDHQRISAVHGDTDNKHLHLAINLLDEHNRFKEPYKAWHKFKDKRRELDERYGFKSAEAETSSNSRSEANAKRESHGNLASFEGWLKDNLTAPIEALLSREGTDWQQLHRLLGENGAQIKKRGAGLVVAHSKAKLFVKASSVSRQLTMKRLTNRLGDFEPSRFDQEAKRTYQTKAVQSAQLYDQYKAHTAATKAKRDEKRAEAKKWLYKQKKRIAEDIKAQKAAFLGQKPSAAKTIALKRLTFERAKQIEAANEEYQNQTKAVGEIYKYRTWIQWLQMRAKGGEAAAIEALRRKGIDVGQIGNEISAAHAKEWKSVGNSIRDLDFKVAANGMVTYSSKKAGEIRDHGRKLGVGEKFNDETVEAALKLAVAKFGRNLRVDGTKEWRDAVAKKAKELRINLGHASER